MEKLTGKEVNKLFDSISTLNSSIDPQTLPERTIKSVSNLIRNRAVSFDIVSLDGIYDYENHWHESVADFNKEMIDYFAQHLHENPLYDFLLTRETGVVRLTDTVSMGDFRKTMLYNEFHRKLEFDYSIHVHTPILDNSTLTCSLDRKNRDFSDAEKQTLKVFSPHLFAAINNANDFRRIFEEKETIESHLNKLNSGVMVLDRTGKVIQRTRSCRKLISRYFGNEKTNAQGIPETVSNWINRYKFRSKMEENLIPPKSLIIEKTNSRLRLSLIVNNQKRQKSVLLEEKLEVSLSQIKTLGLTPREAEVLSLISKGKTNPEIAIITDISPRTVQKHTANIYEKLGVETRTAAALRVNELR